MKRLKGFGIISFCLLLGVIMKSVINYPIPEPVYGMAFLLIALMAKIVTVDDVEDAGDFLLENLAFLFVVPGLALIDQLDTLKDIFLPLIVIVILSTFIGMIITSKTVEFVQNRRKK